MDALPKEIWLYIFNILDGTSLKEVQKVCVAFSEWLTDDLFWFNKIQLALATVNSQPPLCLERSETKIPWKDLYLNLISPYKHLLGLWQQLMVGDEPDGECNRGVLLRFMMLPKHGVIYGYMSQYNPIEFSHSFSNAVVIHSDGEFSSHRPVERYPFGVSKCEQLSLESCFSHRPLDDHCSYLHHVYSSDVMEFDGLTDSDDPTRWLKIRSLTSFTDSMLHAGMYTAVYGGHGTEFIHVCHLPALNVIVGTKLLGDNNVPYGRHTFVVDLTKPLVLTLSQQETCEQLGQVTPTAAADATSGPQPFQLPADMANLVTDFKHTSCLARYVGQMTYAHHNYVEPAWCTAHFVQFSADSFAMLPLRHSPVLVYTRHPHLVF